VAESIRDYFKRRTGRALKVCAIGIVIGAVGVALYGFGYVTAGEVGGVIGLVTLCGGLLYLDLTRCPRCLSRLSATVSSRRLSEPINFCPYCGASLDGPRP
jgi:hypothetical protein